MTTTSIERTSAGTINIPDVINNKFGVYKGDLKHYFRAVFLNAHNHFNPYHNFRHMLHVTWLCHDALLFYAARSEPIDPLDGRHLLIGSMFHDYNHSGMVGDDDLEIERALRGLRQNVSDSDKRHLESIEEHIYSTQFPHKMPSNVLSLSQRIIRDADVSQALSSVWIQQVVFGLSREMNKKPEEILAMQEGFLSNLKFSTEWAEQRFGDKVIQEKIEEARALLQILNEG